MNVLEDAEDFRILNDDYSVMIKLLYHKIPEILLRALKFMSITEKNK